MEVNTKNYQQICAKAKNISLGLISVLALCVAPANALNIGVTPPRIELKIDGNKTRTQSVRVINSSSEDIEIKAYISAWDMSEDNKLQEIASSEQSLAQWIVFTPSRFKIKAGDAQNFRFSIRPKVQPKAGEHRAIIYFEEVPRNNSNSSVLRIVGKIGVVIYANVGDIKREGVINSITVDTKTLRTPQAVFDITSKGNGYVRLNGQYSIWRADKYPGANATKPIENLGNPNSKLPANVLDAGLLPNVPVLPENRRQIRLPITKSLFPGEYILDVNGSLNGLPINKGIPFTIPSTTVKK